jgi:hypothetical protein
LCLPQINQTNIAPFSIIKMTGNSFLKNKNLQMDKTLDLRILTPEQISNQKLEMTA